MPDTTTKQIKFEIIGDASQLNRAIEQAVRGVSNLMGQLNKASGGILGTSTSGTGPKIPGANQPNAQGTNASITRAVEDNRKLLDTLKGASSETMRSMADVASREMEKEKRAIQGLNEELGKLNRAYEQHKRLSGAGYGDAGLNQVGERIRAKNEERSGRQGKVDSLQDVINAGNPPGEPPGPGGGGGFFGANGPLGGLMRRVRGGVALNAALDAVGSIPRELIAEASDSLNADVGQAGFKRMALATRHGDLRYMYAMSRLNGDDMKDLGRIADPFLQGANIAGSKLNLGTLLQAITSPASVGFDTAREVNMMDTKIKQQLVEFIEKKISADPLQYDTVNQFGGAANSRVQMMRMLGMGSEGLDKFTKPLEMSTGYSQGEIAGAFGNIASSVGRQAAKTLTGLVLNGMSAGMNPAMLNSLASAGAMSGNPGLINLIGTQNIGLGAQNSIGAFLASQTINRLGAGDVTGLAGVLTGGMGSDGARNAFDAQQRIAGAGFMGRIVGGIDPYGQGMNLLSAYRNTGGKSIYAARSLMELSGRELANIAAGGAIPSLLRSAGITNGNSAMALLNDSMSTATDYLAFNSDDHSGTANAARALRGNGDIKSKVLRYLGNATGKKRDQRVSDLASVFHFAQGGDMNEATGMVEILANLGNRGAANGTLPDGAGGSGELDLLKQLAKQAQLVTTEFSALAKLLKDHPIKGFIETQSASGVQATGTADAANRMNPDQAAAVGRQNAAKSAATQAAVQKRLLGGKGAR